MLTILSKMILSYTKSGLLPVRISPCRTNKVIGGSDEPPYEITNVF